MAASDKLITIDADYSALTDVYQGESLDIDFDLSDLFGEVIDPADYTEVAIYLYHKYSGVNVGFDDTESAWRKTDVTVTFAGDVATITMTHDRLGVGQTGVYQYLIELSTLLIYRKTSADCFILKYAADE